MGKWASASYLPIFIFLCKSIKILIIVLSDLAISSKLYHQGKEVCSSTSVAHIRGADQRFNLKILIARFLPRLFS